MSLGVLRFASFVPMPFGREIVFSFCPDVHDLVECVMFQVVHRGLMAVSFRSVQLPARLSKYCWIGLPVETHDTLIAGKL